MKEGAATDFVVDVADVTDRKKKKEERRRRKKEQGGFLVCLSLGDLILMPKS